MYNYIIRKASIKTGLQDYNKTRCMGPEPVLCRPGFTIVGAPGQSKCGGLYQ
jgi:hypothetical protein